VTERATGIGGVFVRSVDLDAMLAQLRAAGVPVDDHVEEMEFGRFGWATDPDGNRFELWEPAAGQ
jgi:predicted enzyme related to lactoylglutathione lyase